MANSGEFVGIACGDDWMEATTIRDVYNSSGGAFEIQTAPVLYRLQYAKGFARGHSEQGDGFWTVEKNIGTGGGSIPIGATGVQFKNATPGQIATVSARIHRKDEPFLALTFANPQITVANSLNFQKNGALIANEPGMDLVDASSIGIFWTVTDDPVNNRVIISASADTLLPWLIDISAYLPAPLETNWTVLAALAGLIGGGYHSSNGAQNAEIGWDLILAAGTWTVEVMHQMDTNQGIFSVNFDGVSKGTFDAYNGGGTLWNQIHSVAGIAVPATKKVRVSLLMSAKNGASSAYTGSIQGVRLLRTA